MTVIAALLAMGMWKKQLQKKKSVATPKAGDLDTAAAEGSASTPADDDDEDLLGYSFEDDLSVSFELGGVNMKFKDSALEAKYDVENLRRGVFIGCRILLLVAALVLVNKL